MDFNWLEVITIILGSGVISTLLTGLWLNVRTERIRFELQRNLTKFSLLHQKRAENIEKLHEKLVDLISEVSNFEIFLLQDEAVRNPNEYSFKGWSEKLLNLEENYEDVFLFYRKRLIYFDNDLCKQIKAVLDSANKMLGNFKLRERRGSLLKRSAQENPEQFITIKRSDREAYKNFLELAPKLQNTLEIEFRKLLSSQMEES